MEFFSREMSRSDADEILSWRYDPPYELYNNEKSDEALLELLNGSYHSVYVGEESLFGYYCHGDSAKVPAGHASGAYMEDCLDIGLGMKPQLTGKGKGSLFLSFILDSLAQESSGQVVFRLTVASFNKRAITLYSNHGFVRRDVFEHNGVEFITMVSSKYGTI
ncbi:GNAT family N-acetyltransferase [Bacillus tianshenii]|uniref:GNAT family N-acetyltransferase n=1 Tax=Sutcliffiella tianshenii TaxID=1463404 RepID=UPI001CD77E03|nr:GNAT family protein [Bacillus tianshenii]MCA1319026.1 GNAT family N-acetyltransferase [Bacillus tianshenii]